MVKFKTKIIENKKHGQRTITVPSWIFKNEQLEYDENAEYWVEIEKVKADETKKPL